MANFGDQMEEIRRILSSSSTKSQKPYAYSTLLRIQELATTDSTLLQLLADSAETFVSLIVVIDISDNDEEIAAQALKCLGFMIYHPSIVQTISGDNASLIIDSLVKIITTTRIKSVCNLGVWCIAIQQFNVETLDAHFEFLLRAIAHALDNPMGSLSITFEAMQAIMKLATLLHEKMRDSSDIWAPPIYRRLVSVDKREREISERCLLKIRSIICPAPFALSKAVCIDLKQKLLSAMNDMLNHGEKIQTMRAWGWFFCFLGPSSMKYKNLVNDMLKFPELTFSDFDPQVQIASLLVFQAGPDNKTIWLWNICLDLLDAFTSARSTDANHGLNNPEAGKLSDKNSVVGSLESIKCSWKNYPIKWLTWNLSQLEFFIKMINTILSQGLTATVSLEFRMLALNAALRLFRSLLRAVQTVLKCTSTTYDEVMLCLTRVLRFLNEVCENATSEDGSVVDLCHAYLALLELVTEEIESSILESPLYKLALDLKCLDKLEPVGKFTSSVAPDIRFLSYMDMVSPAVYLTVLFFSLAVNLASKAVDLNFISNRMYRHVQLLLSSYDPLEIFSVFVGLLYNCEASTCLGMWKTLANCLNDYINADSNNNLLLFKKETNNCGCSSVAHLLSYPFVVCSHPQIQHEIQDIIELWKMLYDSVTHALQLQYSPLKSFPEDLSSILCGYLEDITVEVDTGTEIDQREKNKVSTTLLLSGNAISCILEQLISRLYNKGSEMNHGDKGTSDNVKSSLGLAARFMNLAGAREETIAQMCHIVTLRVFSKLIHYVDSLCIKEDIVTFIEIMTGALLKWLSLVEVNNEETNNQLQLLWSKILNSLQRSHPPIKFDSPFLKFQGSLLEKTLDHPNFNISEPTVKFWNSTYGEQLQLEYPQNLLPVLDKLTRNGKINICKRNRTILERNCSGVTSSAPRRYTVTATLTGCSKRVELMKDAVNDSQGNNKVHLLSKRKRPELTEHQKEVRRAQQGRSRDCNGRGPGIRTYTSVDFSQGNEESQESQETRDADTILEMLRSVR